MIQIISYKTFCHVILCFFGAFYHVAITISYFKLISGHLSFVLKEGSSTCDRIDRTVVCVRAFGRMFVFVH